MTLSPTAGAEANAIVVVDAKSGQRHKVPAPQDENITATLLGWSAANELLLGWAHNGEGSCDLMAWDLVKAPRRLALNWSDRMGLEWGGRAALLSRDGKTLWALWSVPEEKAATRACAADLWAWNPRDWKQAPRRLAQCLPWGDSLQEQAGALLLSAREGALQLDLARGKSTPWPALDNALGTQGRDYVDDVPWVDAAVPPVPKPNLAFIAPRFELISPASHVLSLHSIAPDSRATPLLGITDGR